MRNEDDLKQALEPQPAEVARMVRRVMCGVEAEVAARRGTRQLLWRAALTVTTLAFLFAAFRFLEPAPSRTQTPRLVSAGGVVVAGGEAPEPRPAGGSRTLLLVHGGSR